MTNIEYRDVSMKRAKDLRREFIEKYIPMNRKDIQNELLCLLEAYFSWGKYNEQWASDPHGGGA